MLLEASIEYLRCAHCQSKLELEVLRKKFEIEEGFLSCKKCHARYPIISKIPILWDNFVLYLSNRANLGGDLILQSKSSKMKDFVKDSLSKIKKDSSDITWIEKKWVSIYLQSRKSKFYYTIQKFMKKIPHSRLVLEHGCSIGLIVEHLAQYHDMVFGIDGSFYAILQAKKTAKKNTDYFVADSLFHPFGKQKFDLIIGLNLLELIEPKKLVKTIASQIKNGILVLSDPYDFERGKDTVRYPLNEKTLRNELKKNGFKIFHTSKKPSFIPWNLKINKRCTLNYKVDLVIAQKNKK